MKFSIDQDFPQGLDVLWAVYGEASYLQAKYHALGSVNIRVIESVTDDTDLRVVLERTIPATAINGIPDWARKLISRDYVMRHENRCKRSGPAHAAVDLCITPVGSPVSITAQGSFSEPAAGQSRLALVFDVHCRIPLVGGKVAELFAHKIREALTEDYEFTLGYVMARAVP